jgi:hypothetical protein
LKIKYNISDNEYDKILKDMKKRNKLETLEFLLKKKNMEKNEEIIS